MEREREGIWHMAVAKGPFATLAQFDGYQELDCLSQNQMIYFTLKLHVPQQQTLLRRKSVMLTHNEMTDAKCNKVLNAKCKYFSDA